MTWINKTLQINSGSYGVLSINAAFDGSMTGNDFTMTTFSYTDAGGRHDHNNFSFTVGTALKVANILYRFSISKKKDIIGVYFRQQYKMRGLLYISDLKDKLSFKIDQGEVILNKKQAKKVAGYLFFWVAENFIGKRKVKIASEIVYAKDMNDAEEWHLESDYGN